MLKEHTLIGKRDYVYTPPEADSDFQKGDELKIECTAANDAGTMNGLVKATELLR